MATLRALRVSVGGHTTKRETQKREFERGVTWTKFNLNRHTFCTGKRVRFVPLSWANHPSGSVAWLRQQLASKGVRRERFETLVDADGSGVASSAEFRKGQCKRETAHLLLCCLANSICY